MKEQKIRQLLEMLYSDPSQEKMEEIRKIIVRWDIDPAQIAQAVEMKNRYVDVFYQDGRNMGLPAIHSHPFFQLVHCRSNRNLEYLIEGKRYQLQRGDILLLPPGVSHTSLPIQDGEENPRWDTIWISADLVKILSQQFEIFEETETRQTLLLRTTGTIWEQINGCFQIMAAEVEMQGHGWEPSVLGNVIYLLTNIMRASKDPSTIFLTAKRPRLMDEILIYIENNLHRKITLDDVACKLYTSRSTINRLFHTKLNTTFYTYVTERRLCEARNLLLENLPLEQVGAGVGFQNYSVFYRAFKQKYGISPKEFRQKQLEK